MPITTAIVVYNFWTTNLADGIQRHSSHYFGLISKKKIKKSLCFVSMATNLDDFVPYMEHHGILQVEEIHDNHFLFYQEVGCPFGPTAVVPLVGQAYASFSQNEAIQKPVIWTIYAVPYPVHKVDGLMRLAFSYLLSYDIICSPVLVKFMCTSVIYCLA